MLSFTTSGSTLDVEWSLLLNRYSSVCTGAWEGPTHLTICWELGMRQVWKVFSRVLSIGGLQKAWSRHAWTNDRRRTMYFGKDENAVIGIERTSEHDRLSWHGLRHSRHVTPDRRLPVPRSASCNFLMHAGSPNCKVLHTRSVVAARALYLLHLSPHAGNLRSSKRAKA